MEFTHDPEGRKVTTVKFSLYNVYDLCMCVCVWQYPHTF